LPPIGYRIVAGEQRGQKTKKTLEVDPFQAEIVRLIFRLAREGDGDSGALGVKSIAQELRIMGSKGELLRTLVAASSTKTADFGVRSSVPKWRPVRDSNPCYQRERLVSWASRRTGRRGARRWVAEGHLRVKLAPSPR
jgi:hypothetical protein